MAECSRRTARLECIVHHLGLALGGRPAAGNAKRLMVPTSNDMLLRVARRRANLPDDRLNVIGIDDWAWRRNHRYGSIVCDLERRRIVRLLPDREIATVRAGLAHHLQIAVVLRDRGGGHPPRERLMSAMEEVMLETPANWRKYYSGAAAELWLQRHFSYSDRIRYYWPAPRAKAAVEALLARLGQREIPSPVLTQYLPALAAGRGPCTARALLLAAVEAVLETYEAAFRPGLDAIATASPRPSSGGPAASPASGRR